MSPSSSAGLRTDSDHLVTLTQRLAPPSVLGSALWQHHVAQDDPTGARYSALQRWIKVRSPEMLQEMLHGIKAIEGHLAEETRKQVIIAATRFTGRDAWSCGRSRKAAEAILSHPSLAPSVPLVRSLLLDHLRPLFRSSTSSTNRSKPTLDPETSRVLPPRTGLSAAYDHPDMADEVSWKGGSDGPRVEVNDDSQDASGAESSAQADVNSMMALRSPGLGAPSLVEWCCGAAARLAREAGRGEGAPPSAGRGEGAPPSAGRDEGAPPSAGQGSGAASTSSSNGGEGATINGLPAMPSKPAASPASRLEPTTSLEVWDALLPPLVPPLLALLEDPDPRYRTTGARSLSALLSSDEPSATASRHLSASPSLERMRLTPLLLQNLFVSFTFLTHERGPPLLDAALRSSRELILSSTAQSFAGTESEEERRRGEGRRQDALSAVLEEGVFHAWTYGGAMPTASDDDDDDELEPDTATPSDTLVISLSHLLVLIEDLGLASARYISLILEFLSGNLSRLTFDVDAAREGQRGLSLAGALERLVRFWGGSGEDRPPGLARWSGRCVAALAKCWVRLGDVERGAEGDAGHKGVREKVRELRRALQGALRAYIEVDEGAKELANQLVNTEPELFRDLVEGGET